jgi:hypothetical protein
MLRGLPIVSPYNLKLSIRVLLTAPRLSRMQIFHETRIIGTYRHILEFDEAEVDSRSAVFIVA